MTPKKLLFCKRVDLLDRITSDCEYVEKLNTTDASFCYKLHKLKGVLEATYAASVYFSRSFIDNIAIVVDISPLKESFFRTKGSELLTDLLAIMQAPYANMLKVVIVYKDYIPNSLKEFTRRS